MSIPITNGSGQSSVAAEAVGGLQYQQIEVLGGGGSSVLSIAPDGSAKVSIVGTVQVTGSIVSVGNQSVSGTVDASVIGWVPVQLSNTSVITVTQSSSIIGVVTGSVVAIPTGNQSVSGTVGASVIGWVATQPSNTSTIGVIQGSVAAVIVGGSIAASFTPPANQSVSGTIQADVRGSIAAVIIGGSIAASFTPPANQSVSGTVDVAQIGAWRTSVISSTPSSMLAGASIFGQLPAGTAVLGSVAALQGTNPWITTPTGNQSVSGALFVSGSVLLGSSNASVITVERSSSIIAINAGSVVTISQGSVITVARAPSIVGTYVEDAAHATGDRGLFVMQVRNDLMTSVTSADGDYSPIAGGPVGETITANSPITKWVRGVANLSGTGATGTSVIVISAGGTSVFTYVTGVQVANMGSASVLVTLASGGSTLGYTIAPAGGGSNIQYINPLKTPENFGFAASISGVASVFVSAQGFTAKT